MKMILEGIKETYRVEFPALRLVWDGDDMIPGYELCPEYIPRG
jgi:hypothetical protein